MKLKYANLKIINHYNNKINLDIRVYNIKKCPKDSFFKFIIILSKKQIKQIKNTICLKPKCRCGFCTIGYYDILLKINNYNVGNVILKDKKEDWMKIVEGQYDPILDYMTESFNDWYWGDFNEKRTKKYGQ